MFGRASFGVSQPNSFGFGSGTSASFGQPNQPFGNTNTSFGTASSGFGSASQPIFGAAQQNTTPLFGATAAPAFGQSNQPSGFGTSLFGSNTQQPSASGGIFGTSSSTNFGQQPKSTGFGFPSTSSSGLFGQNTQPQQNAASMFQPSSSSALFGSSTSFGGAQTQTGTVNKFVPVTGTDSVQKSGVVQSINTKHHCITCMKEYENKSLEELRYEDYQANRKGVQQGPSFGAPAQQPFGITSATTLFGQTENKPAFGQTSATFGQPSFGVSSQTTPSNIFGKPSTGFGNTSTTNSFAFGTGTPTAGPFGSGITSKPFATPATQTLFGPTQPQQSSFGTNTFGQSSTQPTSSSNLFTKPTQQQGFNMGQSSFQFGSQPQNSTNVFQTPKTNTTGFNIFGPTNTTTPAFGQQQQQQSTFTPFNNFGKPPQPAFGQTTQSIFGTGLNSTSIFGNNANKNLFTPTTNLFGNAFQSNTGFAMPSQQPQQQPMLNMQAGIDTQLHDSRPFLQLADPYGYHPHLDGLSPVKQPATVYTTNPKELQKYLEVPQPIAIVSPTQKRLKVYPPLTKKKGNLFDDDIDSKTSEINFSLKRSAKRLIICKEKPDDGSKSIDVDNTSFLRRSTSESKENTATPPSFRKLKTDNLENSADDEVMHKFEKPVMTDKESQVDEISGKSDKADSFLEIQDTCGIKLTRPEYYTVPPLEKLHEHKQPDGQCLVKGFTVGRIGYGNVSFPDLMDVSNLDLDDIVHFRYREVTIYPDDSKKPPLGQGLNRRAQVTLDRVYPKGMIDRKIITDVKILIAINFSESLRNLCDKHGTKFVDYRPETGSWVFMVDHFSKHTFSDADEETTLVPQPDVQSDCEILFMKNKGNQTEKKKIHEEIIAEDDDITITDSAMLTDGSVTEVSESGDHLNNVDIDECQPPSSVQSSDDLHHVQSRRHLYQERLSERMMVMKATLFKEDVCDPVSIESDNIETLSKTSDVFKDLPKPTVSTTRIEKLNRPRPRTFSLINKCCTVPLTHSYYNCRNYMDMGAFKSRSFRAGWGRGFILVTNSNAFKTSQSNMKARNNKIGIVDVSNLTGYDPLLESLPVHLHYIMEASQFRLIDGVPFFSINKDKTSLKRHQKLASKMYHKSYNSRDVRYFSEVWDLLVALWGDMDDNQTRRECLSNWLKSSLERITIITATSFSRFQENVFFDVIFSLLVGYQIRNAATVAIHNKLPNLALLITQRNEVTGRLLQMQIDQWRQSTALEHIDPMPQKIYMLLSGILEYEYESDSSKKVVNVFDNLNWKQCLAVILWYMVPRTESISKTIFFYQQAFEKEKLAKKPTSEYLDEGMNILDLQYHLLLLYCKMTNSLEEILNPLTHTSYSADYRLSWMLLQILSALDVGRINDPAKNIITTSFSTQLESFGLTKWAIFVLLFIEDSSVRKNLVINCLQRNLFVNPSEQLENELVRDLHIPSEWIHEIKSYRSQSLGLHVESYKHLAYINLWNEAHKVVMESIMPDLIVNDNFDAIRNILHTFQPESSHISTWTHQGGVLCEFIKIMDLFNNSDHAYDKEQALLIHNAVLAICQKLQNYPRQTPKQIAALSELSKRCLIYIHILMTFMAPSDKGIINITEMEVNRLVMPPDYLVSVYKYETFFK